MTIYNYSPEDDGVSHINIWSGAKTELGKSLSHFKRRPFVIDGVNFQSLEGYWHWLKLDLLNVDRSLLINLPNLYGQYARTEGRGIAKDNNLIGCDPTDDFWDKFKKAIKLSINSDRSLRVNFESSALPFTHYYSFGDRIIKPKNEDLLINLYEELRKELREE